MSPRQPPVKALCVVLWSAAPGLEPLAEHADTVHVSGVEAGQGPGSVPLHRLSQQLVPPGVAPVDGEGKTAWKWTNVD